MVLIKKEEEEVEESRGNKLYQERERERFGFALMVKGQAQKAGVC